MDRHQLEELLPDLDTAALALACKHPSVRSAIADLAVAEAELARCAGSTRWKEDWEATKSELLDEIRRLTLSLGSKA